MKQIYGIRDRLAGALVGNAMYLLMCFRTEQEATRYFADAIFDEKSILAKHPADYELVCCGTLDEDGTIVQLDTPAIVVTGDTIKTLFTAEPTLVREA